MVEEVSELAIVAFPLFSLFAILFLVPCCCMRQKSGEVASKCSEMYALHMQVGEQGGEAG